MASDVDNRKLGYRILLGAIVFVLGGSMLLYLVPQGPGTEAGSTETVARVGDQAITLQDVRQQLADIEKNRQVPKQFESIYAQQILRQLVFDKEIEYEAKRLGITVTNEETADRITQYMPAAFSGDSPIGIDQYTQLVQQNFQMPVQQFEELVRKGILTEKFQKMITDGISVSPAELQEQFLYQNQKVKLDYVLIKPDELEAKIVPSDAEIRAEYEKSKAKYQVPEKRVVRYGLVDVIKMRQDEQISDQELRAQYAKNIHDYEVPSRVHVEHILFMTVGKTDAEIAEIKAHAEDVLKQVKKGGNFEDLAKKYSEDPGGSKEKGGDLGWIVQGQTVPEFEKAAFGLPKGAISDLVKTQYGFHILKIIDKESAHTKTFEEVKDSLKSPLLLAKADQAAADEASKLSAAIRRSSKTSLDDLVKEFHLEAGVTRPLAAGDPVLELGNSKEVKDAIFSLRPGDVHLPIQTDRGYVVLSLQSVLPAHQGTLDEVRDRVIADLKQQKAAQLARTEAEDLVKRAKAGEKFEAAAKSLGLGAKTSDPVSRSGSISGVGSGSQFSAAFQMKAGEVAPPQSIGANWFVYRVADRMEPNPSDFDAQKKTLADQALQDKRNLAFEAFRTALENRLKQEGKLQIMPEKLKGFGDFSNGGSL
jgi:peptidyl-prolyl cis-trans isomerase D